MILDVIRSIFKAAISFGNIGDKQMLDQTFGVLVEFSWELYLALQNLLIDSHRVIIVEWVYSCNHFVR